MSHADRSRPTNRLASETSAYLRQHMHNPVDWYPWGPEALAEAARADKPLLVSIGYSACHWCHVMERESFEDPTTAALMNDRFVCIKVDREERPDVDQVYMDAVMRFVGRGGWPLTMFCKPGGEPFYGGTYFPPERRHGMPAFAEILEEISRAYRERRGEVDDVAARLIASLDERPAGEAATEPGTATLAAAARRLLARADREHGGFGGAPKFPSPPSLEALLAAADALPTGEARDAVAHVVLTCHRMARGGVYDHVGGGFHRYAVDGHWGVPHFEKMLYDQGQLLRVYTEVWRRSGASDGELLWPIRETVAFLRRDLSADPDTEQGGLYASLDADSEGEEGLYYVWTPTEIEAVLGAERGRALCTAYGVTAAGNFESTGATVLYAAGDAPRDRHARDREALLEVRRTRVAPATDRKRVAGWNGLAISGLARAGSLLGDASMLGDARSLADFALDHFVDADGRRHRIFDEAGAHGPVFLDDLAALLEAFLDLHRACGESRYLSAAFDIADDVATRFFDAAHGDLFLTPSDGERLVHRPRSDHDGATPHSAGLATLGLIRASTLAGRDDWRDVAERVLQTHARALEHAPDAFPTLARAAMAAQAGISVAVIAGDPAEATTQALAERARRLLGPVDFVVIAAPAGPPPPGIDPHWLSGRTAIAGRPTAYVCHGSECTAPVHTPEALSAP